MGYRNREIEMKMEVLNGESVHRTAKVVSTALSNLVKSTVIGHRTDEYWEPLRGMKADFIRLRRLDDERAQLTVKHTDKDDNLDRVEIDLIVEYRQAKKFLVQLLGEPAGKIKKLYHILILGSHDHSAVVYKVDGYPKLFLEIEGKSVKQVQRLVDKVTAAGLKTKRIKKSLYQLVVKKGKR